MVCEFELCGSSLEFMITAMQTENLIIGRIGRVELRFIAILLRFSLHHTGSNVRLKSIFCSNEYAVILVVHERYTNSPFI